MEDGKETKEDRKRMREERGKIKGKQNLEGGSDNKFVEIKQRNIGRRG